MKYIFVENGNLNGAGELEQLDEGVLNIQVSDEVYKNYLSEKFRYVYSDGAIVENPNYENAKQTAAIEKRISEIHSELEALDEKRIRAVCESEVKDIKTGETWLEYYNSLIIDLRSELIALEAQI